MPLVSPTSGVRALRLGCLGDSITADITSSAGGYRGPLADLIGGYYRKSVQWMGWNTAANATSSSMIGASGITLATCLTGAYATDAQTKALALDGVFIHIGSNDATAGRSASAVRADMNTLLDRFRAANPTCHVFLAKIIPNTNVTPNANVQLYNAEYGDLAVTRSDSAYIHICDHYSAFTANASWETVYMDDTIHPNAVGYQVMTTTWYNQFVTVF